MPIFDIYRSGYELGFSHGRLGSRRQPRWELLTLNPICWLPGVDVESFVSAYRQGYLDGTANRRFLGRL